MNNLQLYVAIGLPTLAVLTSLIVSMVQISGIRGDLRENVREIRGDLRENMREIRSEIRDIRSDIKLITGSLNDLDTRVSRIEDKLGIVPR